MSWRTDLSTQVSSTALNVATALGETLTLSHRGANAVTLYAIPKSRGLRTENVGGSVTEYRQVSFSIPIQTGFAVPSSDVEPISMGDLITYQSRAYLVQDYSDDSVTACYSVDCEEEKRLSSGVG